MNIRLLISLIAAATTVAVLSGCAAPFPVYSAAGKNVAAVRELPRPLQVRAVSGSQSNATCRLVPIIPDGGKTYADYVRHAFDEEITMAGRPAGGSPLEVSLKLIKVDVDCGILEGAWVFDVELTVGRQAPVALRIQRPFDGNYIGTIVVDRATKAFVPSVQDLVQAVLRHPAMQAAARAI